MRFGVREICDVVLKAKSIQQVGNKVFYKDEPVLYFDSLKTSSLEGAATTVYAQGGRGNSRLVAWEGERTITFTMEDALLSPASFAILSGAGLMSASDINKLKTPVVERTAAIEFVAKGEEYADYSSTQIWFEDKRTDEGWENPHYPLKGAFYAYGLSEGHLHLVVDEPICHICEDENDEYNGKYMWFSKGTTVFTQENAKDYYGPDPDPESLTEAETNLVFIYIKQRPLIKNVSGSFYNIAPYVLDLELDAPIYIMRTINDEVVTEPFYANDIQIVANENHLHYGEYRITLKTTDDLDKGFLRKEIVEPEYYEAVMYEGKDTTQGWANDHQPDAHTNYYTYSQNGYVLTIPYSDQGEIADSDGDWSDEYYWFDEAFINAKVAADDYHWYISDAQKFYTRTEAVYNYELIKNCTALINYYTEKSAGYQIDITPDKFGGNYYLEASTLFRDQSGVDLPAEFIIPNCKIQSNFTFTMASSGDPSTFTFTMDAFPDYTRFDSTKKVLVSIQILDVTSEDNLRSRTISPWNVDANTSDAIREKTWTGFEPANN